jgi:hypothetical protein
MYPDPDHESATMRVGTGADDEETLYRGSLCRCQRNTEQHRESLAELYDEEPDGYKFFGPSEQMEAKTHWAAIARIEANCGAAIHYPEEIVAAIGGDPHWSPEEEARLNAEAQDEELAAQASLDAAQQRWAGEYDGYEEQEAFVQRLVKIRRWQLIRLCESLGIEPRDPRIARWVKACVAKRDGNLLRGYCSAIAALPHRVS